MAALNGAQRHSINRVLVDTGGENACVSVDFAVGFEVQVSVEQLSVDTLERQTLFASLMNQFQINVGVLHCAYLSLLKLYDTSPAFLYQGNALAYFRKLPLRPVSGATVSDYYGGSATVGVAACRSSRFYDFETFSVFRCPVLYVHTKLIVCGPLERAFHRLIYQRCITACNYTSCIFQRRRFRHGATGAAYHHRELGFVVHSPCTQDSQSVSLHTFDSPPLYWHAAVLFGFPRQVSQCPEGICPQPPLHIAGISKPPTRRTKSC